MIREALTLSADARSSRCATPPLSTPRRTALHRLGAPSWLLSTVGLAAFYAVFAILHFRGWVETGRLTGLGVLAQETLVVALFIVRRRANHTSHNPFAWIATGIGAFGVLALRPITDDLGHVRLYSAAASSWLAAARLRGLARLPRQVVRRRRPRIEAIRTGGPYGWVRHPVYACYAVANLGYLLENPTLWNLAVILVQGAFQLVRITHEEAVLSSDPEYTAYRDACAGVCCRSSTKAEVGYAGPIARWTSSGV